MIEIKGKTLALRTMNLKELRALWRKYIPTEGTYTYDEEAVDKRFERMEQISQWNPTVGIFTKNDEIVGELSFERIVFSEQRCDLSLMLANDTYRNKGLGTEAVTLAKSYAKDKLGLKRMYAEVEPSNTAMKALLKKCGFQHIRTLPAGAMVFFAIL